MVKSSVMAREPAKPVVAYINMSLHEDGGVTVKTSDHIKSCASINDARSLQRQLVKAHQAHISITAQTHAEQKNARREQRAKDRAPGPDDDDPETKKQLESIPQQMLSIFQHQQHRALNQDTAEESSDSEDDVDMDVPVIRASIAHSFMIQETEKVTDFLKSRLAHIQQISVKRLAKAWIKGICPKKQALFPYHSHKKVPGWWPNTKHCPFREPDHIRKEDRLHLCLHLLRLRPKLGDMREWNDDQRMPHATYDTGGWTNFLRDIAPPDAVKDLRETEANNERRAKYVKEIYDIMQMEEEYLNDGIDGTDQFFWREDPVDTLIESRASSAFQRKRVTTEPSEDTKPEEASSVAPQKSGRTTKSSKTKKPAIKSDPSNAGQENNAVSNKKSMLTRYRAALLKPDDNDVSTRERTATPVNNDAVDNHKRPVSRRPSKTRKRARLNDKTSLEITVPSSSSLPAASISLSSTTSPASAGPPSWPSWGTRTDSMRTDGTSSTDVFQSSFSSSTTTTSFCPTTLTDSFCTEPRRSSPLSMGLSSTPMPSLHFEQESRAIPAHMITQIPQPFFRTLPNSPIMPHPSLLGIPQDHSAAIMSSMQPHPWVTSSWPTSFVSTLYDGDDTAMQDVQRPTAQPMIRHGSEAVYNPLEAYPCGNWGNPHAFWATQTDQKPRNYEY